MNFFSNCKDHEEAKKIYRNLSKAFHPDRGGCEDLMKELNKQFDSWQKYASYDEPRPINRFERVDSEFGLDVNYYKMRCESLEREVFQQKHNLSRFQGEIQVLLRGINYLKDENYLLRNEIIELKEKFNEEKKKIRKRVQKQKNPTKRTKKVINLEG